ncbi:MAG: hypothetical protein HY765_08085, partial [Rhodomicrobium sp.]|nr:hypothetical protein [Rhodomicrobium sp.]
MRQLVLLAQLAAGQFASLGLAFGLTFLPLAAIAAPLGKDACAKLAQDLQDMKALDVERLMENGPSWAVSHLSPADLNLVRRYIDLGEQVKFRCTAPGTLVRLKHIEEEEGEGGPKSPAEVKDKGPGKAQAGNSQASAPSPAPKPKPVK